MLNPKVLLVSAIAVTTAFLFVRQVEPGAGRLTRETQCRLSNVTECQPRTRRCTCNCLSADGNNNHRNISAECRGQQMVTCFWQVNTKSANRCCICVCPTKKQLHECCLADQSSCAQISEQSSVQEAFHQDQNDKTTCPTVEVPAASSLDSKILPASSLNFKTSTSASTILTSFLPFRLKDSSIIKLKDSSIMSTDNKPDVSMSLGPLLAGVLSVVGILCIAALASVVVLLIIIRTMSKKAKQVERVTECNCYEEVPNNNSNRNPNTETGNSGCVNGRLFPNPVYSTSPLQEESNTTPLYQYSSFDDEDPSLMHIYERVLATNQGVSNELCHSPAPYETPISHPTKSAMPVAVVSNSKST